MQYASKILQADMAVVLAAVNKDGMALQYASKALRNDKAVVLAAMKQCGLALSYASMELLEDADVVELQLFKRRRGGAIQAST